MLTESHIHDLETADTTADRTSRCMTISSHRGSTANDPREQRLPPTETEKLTNRRRQKMLPTHLPID